MLDRIWICKSSLACAVVAFCAVMAGAEGNMHPTARQGASGIGGRLHQGAALNPSHRSEEAEETNPLVYFWRRYKTGPGVHKWVSYLDVYHEYFKRFRGRNVRLLQVGVQSGGDIRMWREYFMGGLEYHGIDINPECRKFEGERSVAQIIIGDQGSPRFWDEIIPKLPMFDIIIDDGGHTMIQQITSLRKAFPNIMARGGVYLVEDTATSVWERFGGSVASLVQRGSMTAPRRSQGQTFLEFSQSLLAELYWHHAMVENEVPEHARNYAMSVIRRSPFFRKIKSIHFHNQIVIFIEGDVMDGNRAEKRGDTWIQYYAV